MEAALLITCTFLGIFTFAFGAAWIFPLCAVNYEAEKQNEVTKVDASFALFDILLLLFDSIPLFWLISLLFNRSKKKNAAQYKWSEEPAIRRCFYLWLGCFGALIAVIASANLFL